MEWMLIKNYENIDQIKFDDKSYKKKVFKYNK